MSKTQQEPKSKRTPVRSPEYVEARIRRDLRLERDRLAAFELHAQDRISAIKSNIAALEAELSEHQSGKLPL